MKSVSDFGPLHLSDSCVAEAIEKRMLKGGTALNCGCIVYATGTETFRDMEIVHLTHYQWVCDNHKPYVQTIVHGNHSIVVPSELWHMLRNVLWRDGSRVSEKEWKHLMRCRR